LIRATILRRLLPMTHPVLVVDVGATTTRLALARKDGSLDGVRSFANDAAKDLATLLAGALDRAGPKRPVTCALAVAGPIDGDRVTLTNRAWSFSRRGLARTLKLKRLLVVNDFVAIAHALPALRSADLVSVGGGRGDARGTLLACGPGTGFGVGVLLRAGRRMHAMASEAGHMRLGAATADEARIVAHLVREQGPVAVEDVLSGPGLARLHRILADEKSGAETIVVAARAGNGKARATIDVFLRLFGRIAGDLALAFDARGGVYLAGGLGRALAPLVSSSPFRAAFEEHPPYESRLASIPTHIIVHPVPGLIGAAELARVARQS
jgi:glucokinase